MPKGLAEKAESLAPKLSRIRRQIHMYPELAYQEKRTSEFVAKTLRQAGIEVKTGVAKTGVVGLLRGGSPGKTVALRGDMDALPITEQNTKPYKSRVDGVMHACGHDGNTTTVLGAAMLLAKERRNLRGNVKFFFQPSEEAPPGGAMPMIKEGACGVISVASNIIPAEVVSLIRSALDGDYVTAQGLHDKYAQLFDDLFIDTNPIPIKAAMAMKGMIEETYRLPMCSTTIEKKAVLEASLKNVGVL